MEIGNDGEKSGMTGLEIGNDGGEIGNDGAAIIIFSLMSARISR